MTNKRMQVPEYTLLVRNSVQKQNGKADKLFCVWGRGARGEKVGCDAHVAFTQELSARNGTTSELPVEVKVSHVLALLHLGLNPAPLGRSWVHRDRSNQR